MESGMGARKKGPRDDEWPKIVRFQDAVVKVFRRGDGNFIASWRENGRRRTTSKAGERNALEWAQAKARALGQATGQQWVTPAQAEALQSLRKLAGPGDGALGRLIEEVKAAKNILGTRADLPTAVRWFADHGPAHAKPISVAIACTRFLAEYEGRSKSTQRTFGSEVKAFSKKFGEMMLGDITESMLRTWVDRRIKEESRVAAPRTVLSRITTLTTLFNRAKAWGVLPEMGKSAAEKLRRPKIPSAGREIFTVHQGSALLDAVREDDPKLEAFLILGAWLGLRPSEAVKVRRKDFDFDGGYLHATTETVLKTGQERYVPMAPGVAARLKVVTADKGPMERVCVYRSREYLSLLARKKGVVSKWPVDVLRHSFCSYRLAIVGDIGRVAEEAGNSPKMIRDHYRRPLKKKDGLAWWGLLE